MIFTTTYISMCKASGELQALKPKVKDWDNEWDPPHPGIGSFFVTEYLSKPDITTLHWDYDEGRWRIGDYCQEEKEFTWLPRLDQLLGMLGRPIDFINLSEGMNQDFYPVYAQFANDWHKLALAVVMREKFNKIWDGKEWKVRGTA